MRHVSDKNSTSSPFLLRAGAALGVGAVLSVGGAAWGSFAQATPMPGPAATAPAASAHAGHSVLASAPQLYNQSVTDEAGVLSDSDISDLQARISQAESETGKMVYVVFVNSFDGTPADTWGQQAYAANAADNLILVAVAVKDRQFTVKGGTQLSDAEAKKIGEAMTADLRSGNWNGAAQAAINQIQHGNDVNPTPLLVGAGGAAAVGGGALWWSRRNRKRRTTAQVGDARNINPADTGRLQELDTDVLDQLSKEELTSTDESIRRAETELEMATAEFGTDRTRPLAQALARSRQALAEGFQLRQRLDDSIPESAQERRDMMVTIINHCGTADDALDSQTEEFAKMRELMLNSDSKYQELTQQVVNLSGRLPQSRETLAALNQRYPDSVVLPIAQNPDVAAELIHEADDALSTALNLRQQPAGQQTGLLDALNAAETALKQAATNLDNVDRAEERILEARRQMTSLIDEVAAEIQQADALLMDGSGANIDVQQLASARSEADRALTNAKTRGEQDPLETYSALLDADATLDTALANAQNAKMDHQREMQLLAKLKNEAAAQIGSANDLISSRGRIIGGEARTSLHTANQIFDDALRAESAGDTRAAINAAQESSRAARNSLTQAKRDIRRFEAQQFDGYGSYNYGYGRRRRGGSNTGAFIAGAVLSSILNSGGGGGFGGGGGGFGGGGFGGGGGGGFSGRF